MFIDVIGIVLGLHVLYGWATAWSWMRKDVQIEKPYPPQEGWPSGISIIVPAWNDASVLNDTLAALQTAQRHTTVPTELLIVAGGRDETYQVAQDWADRTPHFIQCIEQYPQGKNAALNRGLKQASYDTVVFVDADTVVDPHWLSALIAPLRDPMIGATTGHFSPLRMTPISRMFAMDQIVDQQILGRASLFGGGTIATRKDVLNRIGGVLPEDVHVGVDWDLSERIKSSGLHVQFVDDARVRTAIAETWKEFWSNEVRWKRAYFRNQWQHLVRDGNVRRGIGLIYTPILQLLLIGGLPTALWAQLKGTFTPTLGWLEVLIWVILRLWCRPWMVNQFTGQRIWFKTLFSIILVFFASGIASWIAIVTIRHQTIFFKGPRPQDAQSI